MDQPTQSEPITSDQDKDIAPKRLDFAAVLERVRTAPCPSDEEIKAREDAERDRRRTKLVWDFLDSAGSRLSECRIGNFQVTDDYQRKVIDALRSWIKTFPERRQSAQGIVLYGPVGTGKDHLAVATVGAVVHAHLLTARWVNGREMFADCRDRISKDESDKSFVNGLASHDILVLSDPVPAIGDLTQYQADILYRICDGRYANGRITVMTLNVANDEEADRRLGAATWDRICHGAYKLACMWPSYRKPAMEVTR